MEIKRMLVEHNFNKAPNRVIKFIVIHDTGNTDIGANAEMHYKYFSQPRNASAHYFVDESQIIQIVDDADVAWHCGAVKPKSVDGIPVLNTNSIGIEICINKDGDYVKAVQNALELTKMLMKKYDVPAKRVVRHYDVSGKICPQSMSGYNGHNFTWVLWNWFKHQLE